MSSRVIGFLLAVTIMLLGAVAWTVTSSQALGSITPVTPTYAKSFAVAELAKPTYTPSPYCHNRPYRNSNEYARSSCRSRDRRFADSSHGSRVTGRGAGQL
ncbi:MAG: hypothetical protein IPJ47_08685 [Anaerolineales bacterium]|nr:hypothetical protein [Anaerolineales bacterium]